MPVLRPDGDVEESRFQIHTAEVLGAVDLALEVPEEWELVGV